MVKLIIPFISVIVLFAKPVFTQVTFSANEEVTPYDGFFHPSANIGEYTAFSEQTLADLAAGNTQTGVPGAGVKALRPGLFEGFLEVAGYDANLPVFEHYNQLGMAEHTVIVGFPSPQHSETTQFCPGIPSELFANLYEPVWDGGANGTPVNEDNYYALYLWKTVNTYKDHVRFWEIWNEPGFDYTGGLGFLPPGAPGNWWDNNPDPCDYKLRAPIFHYVRLLRISWEIIKTVDPEAYVVVSGTGYPSFLDAILRNTDNPADGSITGEYPLKGGAYFDVMGFHSYPHFDGSLREWSDDLNDWVYYRHSDAAAEGILKTKDIYQAVLNSHGYDGTTYSEKLWIITEVNLPRKPFGEFIGSAEAQRNFTIKAMVTAMMNDILQLHFYKLAEDTNFENATSEFDLMGLYKRLDYNDLYFQELNEEGVAHKTTSDILFEKTFDVDRTAALGLPQDVCGGAFADSDGNYTYVLWTKTQTDQSETASSNYAFPASLGIDNLLRCEWDASTTHQAVLTSPSNIQLTGTPVFFTEPVFTMNAYTACAPFILEAAGPADGVASLNWTLTFEGLTIASSHEEDPVFTLTEKGRYQLTLEAFDSGGTLLARQTQSLYLNQVPDPEFDMTASGPIVHFANLSAYGHDSFTWEFGDGAQSNDPVPSHVYLESGSYDVTLTAFNECGSAQTSATVEVISPTTTQLNYNANDTVPPFTGHFRPGTSWDYITGWTDEQLSDLISGNVLENVQGIGGKAIRTYIGESFFLGQGYDAREEVFDHYRNNDLNDNTFLLAFPSVQSRDSFYYCPDQQSNLFRDLYLDIWDDGQNGTPVNDENPFALYVYNTVNTYKDHVRFWEIYNSPDFDPTGDRGWLPPGEPGNWWENNPDPCDYELGAPIFYYIRSLRIAYEVIRFLDENAYVTISGISYPSFLDAVCRNTDNPVDGSVSGPYSHTGGAYFDAVGFKSYPHFDGSTIYFDVNAGGFAYERHSDAAVRGIGRMKSEFEAVLSNYGYNGIEFPEKEWIVSEANIPRKQLYDYMGSEEAQRNWTIKAWVESVRNDIRQLNFFRLTESNTYPAATDPFEMMGFYQVMDGVLPYDQEVNGQGVALKTCSDLLYGTEYDPVKTAAMMMPAHIDGAAFRDGSDNYLFVLWAKTETDLSEQASATYSFPTGFGLDQLYKKQWDYTQSGVFELIEPEAIELSGSPVFLSEALQTTMPPVAYFTADTQEICAGQVVQYTSLATGQPTQWEWSFPGGVPAGHSGETPPLVVYQEAGIHPVSLTVSNSAGEHMATYNEYIVVRALPTAEFGIEISGSTVQFTNLSENAETYEWCYGDGYCDNAENPEYIYFENGTYMVTMSSFSDCGSADYELTFTIEAAPTAAFTYEYWGDCSNPQAQFLDLSYGNPESWSWLFPGADPPTSEERYPVVTFPGGGFYEITLVAGNGLGQNTLTREIYIEGDIATDTVVVLCAGDSYNGLTVNNDTTVTFALLTQNSGCDSLLTAFIEVDSLMETFFSIDVCEGEPFNGFTVTQDTMVVEVYNLTGSCDSVSTTTVTMLPNEEIFLAETINEGGSFAIGNELFSETGEYEVELQTYLGCDSLVHLDLTVLTGSEEIIPDNGRLFAFPNPFTEIVQLTFELSKKETVTLDVFDARGRLMQRIYQCRELPAGEYRINWEKGTASAGVYFLRLKTAERIFFRKIIAL